MKVEPEDEFDRALTRFRLWLRYERIIPKKLVWARFQIDLPKPMLDLLDDECRRRGVPRQSLVKFLIFEWLEAELRKRDEFP